MADGDQISLIAPSQPKTAAATTSPTTATTGSDAYAAAVSGDTTLNVGNWKNNPNYKLVIANTGATVAEDISVTSYIPESTRLRLQNQWETILSVLGGGAQKVNTLASVAGVSVNYKALTTKIWRHSEPLTFDFNLQFDAVNSVQEDVVKPIMNLIKLTSPGRTTGNFSDFILIAPGPSLADGLTGLNRRISLRLGKFLYIDSVIINSLDITVPTAFEASGLPTAIDADVSLETFYTPDRQDIEQYFSLAQSIAQNPFVSNPNPLIYNPYVSDSSPTQRIESMLNNQ